jgi:hypothetical protein
MDVFCCEYCELSGRGLCDELITRSEESYRMWRVVVCDLETSKEEAKSPLKGCENKPTMGCDAERKKNYDPRLIETCRHFIQTKRLFYNKYICVYCTNCYYIIIMKHVGQCLGMICGSQAHECSDRNLICFSTTYLPLQ